MLRNILYKLPSLSSLYISIETPPNDRFNTWQYLFIGLMTFFSCYFGLSAYSILDMNEGLYAEVAREMLINKHYIIPYLNNVPYLEKPPLFYWLIAFSYRIFGVTDFATRVVPSTITALTILSFMFFGKKVQAPRTGWIASLILLSSLIFIMIGRTVFFDMLLTLCMTFTLMSFYFWYQERDQKYLYLSYVFLALAILTKGFLAGVLIPLIVLAFMIVMKTERSRYRELLNSKAIILFLVVVLPWHLLAMVSQSGFTWEYFVNNQIMRFFNARLPHDYHTGPIYFYVPRVIAYLLPWSIFLPFLFPWPLRFQRPLDPIKTLFWLWFLIPFVFFSLSGDKGDYYMVIATPPLAYLIAQKIDGWMEEGKTRFIGFGFSLISITMVVSGAIGLLFFRSSSPVFASAYQGNKIPYVLTGAVVALFIFFVVYWAIGSYLSVRNKGRPALPFLLITLTIVPALLFYLVVREKGQFVYSQVTLAKYIRSQYVHRPLFLFEDYEAISSIVYYNQESSDIINSTSSDLHFGSTTEEGKSQFINMDQFLSIAKKEDVYVALRASKLDAFEKLAGNKLFCVVQRNANVILLSNANEDCRASIEEKTGVEKTLDVDISNNSPAAIQLGNHD